MQDAEQVVLCLKNRFSGSLCNGLFPDLPRILAQVVDIEEGGDQMRLEGDEDGRQQAGKEGFASGNQKEHRQYGIQQDGSGKSSGQIQQHSICVRAE